MAVIFIFLFSIGHNVVYSTSQQTDNLPLIYHYSETDQAFIVEKANGNDSRILIDYELCSGCWIFGPGWSSSGDWFAWTVDWIPTTAIPLAEASANVVSKSGEQFLIISANDERVRNLAWSPVSDLLFFEVYVGESSIPTTYYIWDATNQQTAFTLERDTVGLIEAAWTPSGELVTYSNQSSDEAIMRLYTPSGALIIERTIKSVTNPHSFTDCNPKWSNHNQVAFLTPDNKLVVENQVASTRTTFDFPAEYLLDVDWSSDGMFAFIFAANECVLDPYGIKSTSLWKLALADETLEIVSEKGLFNPVQDKRLAQVSAWSPTDDYWYFTQRADDDTFHLTVLDTETSGMRIIDEVSLTDFLLAFRSNHAIWINSSELVFLNSANNDASVLYSYVPQTASLSILAKIEGRALPASYTSAFVSFGNNEQCISVCIVNLSDRILSSIATNSGPLEIPNPAQEIIWNPSGDWMFIASTPIGSTRYISIADIDGDVIRNIDGRFALFQPASFGWVPECSSS